MKIFPVELYDKDSKHYLSASVKGVFYPTVVFHEGKGYLRVGNTNNYREVTYAHLLEE